jgi:hypothetical protein
VRASCISDIIVYCDNKKAVERIVSRCNNKRTTNQHCFADYDIEAQLLAIITELSKDITIKIQYIPGHSDTKKDPINISFEDKLNIEAHRQCLAGRLTAYANYHPFPTSNSNFTISNQSVCANSGKIAIRCFHGIDARQFLQIKYNWLETTVNSIWWHPHATSLNKLTNNKRIQIQKFIHNRLPTKKREQYRHTFKCNYCPHCKSNKIIEDENHIIRCKYHTRKTIRHEWINEISTYLSQTFTPIYVKDAIVKQLSSWLFSIINTETRTYDKHDFLDDALSKQEKIGWDNFIRGRLAIEWGRVINRHVIATNTTSSFTAEIWASHRPTQ